MSTTSFSWLYLYVWQYIYLAACLTVYLSACLSVCFHHSIYLSIDEVQYITSLIYQHALLSLRQYRLQYTTDAFMSKKQTQECAYKDTRSKIKGIINLVSSTDKESHPTRFCFLAVVRFVFVLMFVYIFLFPVQSHLLYRAICIMIKKLIRVW